VLPYERVRYECPYPYAADHMDGAVKHGIFAEIFFHFFTAFFHAHTSSPPIYIYHTTIPLQMQFQTDIRKLRYNHLMDQSPSKLVNQPKGQKFLKTPFGAYFHELDQIDKKVRSTQEWGSMLILTIVEEVGEMARAYLAKHGRKPTNISAQKDEQYEQELGDILVAIIRFARIKKINLDSAIKYSLDKIRVRQTKPKQ